MQSTKRPRQKRVRNVIDVTYTDTRGTIHQYKFKGRDAATVHFFTKRLAEQRLRELAEKPVQTKRVHHKDGSVEEF